MKILFVERKLRTDKLGFLYLSAVLKNAGHDVDLFIGHVGKIDKHLEENPVDFVAYSVDFRISVVLYYK